MRWTTPLLILLLLGTPLTTFAAAGSGPGSPSYEVEVIVIENREQDLNGGELWARDRVKPMEADLTQAIVVANAPAESALAETAKRISEDGRYRILLHKRWVQNPEAKSTSQMVRMSDAGELDGYVRFYLSRFLHVEVDLALSKATSGGLFGGNPEGGQLYRLTQQRRVKSQEIHYFDHPLFGALVRVAPIAQP